MHVVAQPAPDRLPDELAQGTPEPLRSQLAADLGQEQVLTRALDESIGANEPRLVEVAVEPGMSLF